MVKGGTVLANAHYILQITITIGKHWKKKYIYI